MNIPKYFDEKYFDDIEKQFDNVIAKYCNSYSESGYDNDGLPESCISDFYIITKNDNKYTMHHYHSENFYGGEDIYFYYVSSTGLCKNLYTSNKKLYKILKDKFDKYKEPELYEIISIISN